MEKLKINKEIEQEKTVKYINYILIFLIIFFILIILSNNENKNSTGITPKKIEISVKDNQIGVDKEKKVNINVYPENASIDGFKWEITNPVVLTIDKDNIIKGKELGKTKIKLVNGKISSNELTIDCVTYITEAKIKNPIDKMSAFQKYKLDIEVFPKEADNKDFSLISANPNIIEIEDKTTLHAKNSGKTKIYIKDLYGKTIAEMEVEVVWIKVQNINLDQIEAKIGVGQKHILYAKLEPINTTNNKLIYESSNKEIVDIDEKGIIKGISPGTAKIKIGIQNEKIFAECLILVVKDKVKYKERYVSGEFEIKEKPLYQSETFRKTNFWEKIELIEKTKDDWIKILDKDGNPGFIEYREAKFYDFKPHLIEDIKYISNKDIQMPSGAEIANALMLLKRKYYNIDELTLLYSLNTAKPLVDNDRYFSGSDPNKYFIGNPRKEKKDGNYGMYANPTLKMIKYALGDVAEKIEIKDESTLYKMIDKGNPLMVWVQSDGEIFKPKKYIHFGNEKTPYLENIISSIVVGYDDNYIYLHNPDKGKFLKQEKKTFFENLKYTNNTAIYIK